MLLIEPKQLCNVFRNVFVELELYGERSSLSFNMKEKVKSLIVAILRDTGSGLRYWEGH